MLVNNIRLFCEMSTHYFNYSIFKTYKIIKSQVFLWDNCIKLYRSAFNKIKMKDELIQTFLDATSDKIISKCSLISYVTLVGLVSQKTFLFYYESNDGNRQSVDMFYSTNVRKFQWQKGRFSILIRKNAVKKN